MKKIFLTILIFISSFALSQKLPILKLANPINTKMAIKVPLEINKDEICVTLVTGGGMSAYDYYTHYIFTNDGDVKGFKEEIPKSYLKNKNLKQTIQEVSIDKEAKMKLLNMLNAKTTTSFLKFSQKDFFKPIKSNKIQFPCVSDAAGYSISFIQNSKQNVYSFHAPELYYSKQCKDDNINRVVLEKFVQLLTLWEVLK
jgi:hypothetical protein